ncbi:DNA-3-methyladenine glycosylase [Actinotalea sp. Marseille-Q4924]|uniref:DNA-3-methyladenine glycosylase n=1 Tax=Actinotalea sp. Marseille-Q4924 TaxID=2866571 RepID=UPI00351CD773
MPDVSAAPDGPGAGRDWFARPVLEVARDLLGAHLTVRAADGAVTVRLTEVEAYAGEVDPGSHAYRGRTARNAVMFGPAGHLYVYRHLGLHHCVNVVTGTHGRASAVLLRAGEVVAGQDLARRRRAAAGVVRRDVDLARGPARLTVALGLDMSYLGAGVGEADDAVRIRPGAPVQRWRTGPRVGVSGDGGDGAVYPWRLWLPDEPTVSDYRPAAPRRRRATGP